MCVEKMSLIRAFIAIEIEDAETLRRIIEFKHGLESLGLDAKFVEDENIHITIRFLGEISSTTIAQIKEILNSVANNVKTFKLKVGGFGAFPDILRPRVLWVGIIEGYERLAEIRKFIDSEIRRKGLREVQEDQHEFSPHITIARLRSQRNVDKLRKYFEEFKTYDFGFTPVTQIKLKKSTLTPRGPIYTDLHSVPLPQ